MDITSIEKISKSVYKRFPQFKNRQPKVSPQSSGRFLLIFSNSGKTPDGKALQQIVRVVATEDGKIIKTSMSR